MPMIPKRVWNELEETLPLDQEINVPAVTGKEPGMFDKLRRNWDRRRLERDLAQIANRALVAQEAGKPAGHESFRRLRDKAEGLILAYCEKHGEKPETIEDQVPAVFKLNQLASPMSRGSVAWVLAAVVGPVLLGVGSGLGAMAYHFIVGLVR